MFVELQDLMKSNKVRGTQMILEEECMVLMGAAFGHCAGNLCELVAALLDWEREI